MRRTPGQKRSTKSSPPPSPNPVKVAKMVADALEIAPRVMIPLEVRVGAREPLSPPVPNCPKSAVIDVLNHEDGQQYLVVIIPVVTPL